MMGKDVERVLSTLNTFKDMAVADITALANATAYQITTEGTHGESEVAVTLNADEYTQDIIVTWSSFSGGDYTKMCTLESSNYANSGSFNNAYASPWKELHTLKDAINNMRIFANSHPTLPWMGDKVALLNLLQLVLTRAVDARLALIDYHDYIQRGYDHLFNGDVPSITFKPTKDRTSTGNLEQEYNENVNIPAKSIDPY